MADIRVTIDRAAVKTFLTSPTGPVAAEARRRATKTAQFARGFAESSRVRRSIRVTKGRGSSYNVVASATVRGKYGSFNLAIGEHEGTRPHIIRPRKLGGMLVFDVGGETVFAREVRHPGTRGTRYLVRGARAAGLHLAGPGTMTSRGLRF